MFLYQQVCIDDVGKYRDGALNHTGNRVSPDFQLLFEVCNIFFKYLKSIFDMDPGENFENYMD
jgi:hypothetical protein